MATSVTKMSEGEASAKRLDVTSAPGNPSQQAQPNDDTPVNMNTPTPQPRGYRADQLVNMAGMDNYSLMGEAPRHTKMVG